jgi:hypothetical protein
MAAFYLWEYTGCGNMLALWYCAEDIASFFERCQYFNDSVLQDVLSLNHMEREYKAFIRHIAYRLHLYTDVRDDRYNWYVAEKLVGNREWREAIIFLAAGMHALREGHPPKDFQLHSPAVKDYYSHEHV